MSSTAPFEQVSDQEINDYISQHWDEFLADAATLISIDSSRDIEHACEGAPFGPGPRQALDAILDIAARMGFEVHDGQGYVGYADLPAGVTADGQTADAHPQQLGIIGHVDVVPAGEGWTYPAFELTEKDDVLLGRGTTDDKIPLLSTLYACKFWMDRNKSFPFNIRFLFGCDEETGIHDVPHYLEHHRAPDFLFTPDADFPLSYGEKGQFGITLAKEIAGGAVVSFDAGTATNAVPGIARAVVNVSPDELPEAERITVEPHEQGALVCATGISGHASLPEGTVNAIGVLAGYLSNLSACSGEERAWFAYAHDLATSTDGAAVHCACSDDDFGALTSVVGTMHKTGSHYELTVDVRFPTATISAALEQTFAESAQAAGATAEVTRKVEPFIVNPNTAPVQALLDAYCKTTGLAAKAFTMGGGTYAREFPHAVSFGPQDFDVVKTPDWVGEMHGANEGVPIKAIHHAIRVYVRAFANLAEVDSLSA